MLAFSGIEDFEDSGLFGDFGEGLSVFITGGFEGRGGLALGDDRASTTVSSAWPVLCFGRG
jgi:hypothetical protein